VMPKHRFNLRLCGISGLTASNLPAFTAGVQRRVGGIVKSKRDT